jgi:hypothetical protein
MTVQSNFVNNCHFFVSERFYFDFCRCKNLFTEKSVPEYSDFCNCCHILITNEKVQRQHFYSQSRLGLYALMPIDFGNNWSTGSGEKLIEVKFFSLASVLARF